MPHGGVGGGKEDVAKPLYQVYVCLIHCMFQTTRIMKCVHGEMSTVTQERALLCVGYGREAQQAVVGV